MRRTSYVLPSTRGRVCDVILMIGTNSFRKIQNPTIVIAHYKALFTELAKITNIGRLLIMTIPPVPAIWTPSIIAQYKTVILGMIEAAQELLPFAEILDTRHLFLNKHMVKYHPKLFEHHFHHGGLDMVHWSKLGMHKVRNYLENYLSQPFEFREWARKRLCIKIKAAQKGKNPIHGRARAHTVV